MSQKPTTTDWSHFRKACPDDWVGLKAEVTNEALVKPALAFYANIERARNTPIMVPFIAFASAEMQRLIDRAVFNLYGKLTPPRPMNEVVDEVDAEYMRLRNLKDRTRTEKIAKDGDQVVIDEVWGIGHRNLEYIARSTATHYSEFCNVSMQSMVVGSWTAFEVMCSDVWRSALNERPHTLSALGGDKSRINVKARVKKKTNDRQAPADDKAISLKAIHDATRGSFDLSNKMGDVLASKVAFTSLYAIRSAYSVAFAKGVKGCKTDKIDRALSDNALDSLAAIRNVIVHNAGIADEDYVLAAKHAKLAPRRKVGQPVEIDGDLACNLTTAAMASGMSLIEAVCEWLPNNGCLLTQAVNVLPEKI
jgi:hypothetical protein